MDKSDREAGEEPTPDTGVDAVNGDDEVTAEVVQDIDSAPGVESPATGEGAISRNRSLHNGFPDDDALQPGFILRDRFEIVELVHSGGMGHVYKALDNRRQRSASDQVHVAIKMMRRSLASGFDARRALEREAARTQQLSHPNIVNIFDFDQQDDRFFIVMEWLDGESLNALLRRTSGRPLATQFVWRIVEGVVSALQHAHGKNIVHADINPSNIFITETQDIKLLDFGVARLASQAANDEGDELVWATQPYASPEVLSGAPPRFEDDIFSLACVAYRALTGKHPFGGRSSREALKEQLAVEPVPGLANRYWRVLEQSLAYERSQRPSSISAFLVDRSQLPGSARPQRWYGRYGLALLALAAVALAVGNYWLTRNEGFEAETVVVDSPPSEQTAVIDEPLVEATTTATLGLLNDASLAMAESRYVEPEEANARTLYRAALALEPGNPDAVAGLREIGNLYVQRAESALRGGDVEGALAAYAVAEESDANNPALTLLRELLLAQANAAIANARTAAVGGDVDSASDWLTQAERYALIDAGTIAGVRNSIEGARQERALLDAIASAEANIAAGNLISPEGDNAHEQLLELTRSNGDDPRVLSTTERLVERLLNRAAFATAAEQFTVAAELLSAAAVFDVLESDVANAQDWLQQAIDLSTMPPAAEAAAAGSVELEEELADVADPAASSSTDEASRVANAPMSESQQPVPLSELDIENFVPPRYPRRAAESELAGFVDLQFTVNTDGSTSNIEIVNAEPGDTFVSSAINAVRQWRFAERENDVRAHVRLRFDPQAIE